MSREAERRILRRDETIDRLLKERDELRRSMRKIMKAWRVELIGVTSIVWAPSRAAARHKCITAAIESGYQIKYTHKAKICRDRNFDGLYDKFQGNTTTPEMAAEILIQRVSS